MKATERFSGRSKQYVKFRPSYSHEVIEHLQQIVGITTADLVADIGAGTGIFTEKLLEQGIHMVAVEPNDDMRHALIEQLQSYLIQDSNKRNKLLVSGGSAEGTGLADHSIDHIVCAQAYHWFDPALARREFIRILKQRQKGQVVLLWNQRDVDASNFMKAYDELFLKYGKQYDEVKHKKINQASLKPFYGGKEPQLASFQYAQELDKDGLSGRIQSSSFSILENDPRFDEYVHDIELLFEKHQQNGNVKMLYRTDVYWGQMI